MNKIEKTIHLEHAGSLGNILSEEERKNITHLKISGFINSSDFDVLSEMCSSELEYDDYDNETILFNVPPFLTVLDLGDSFMTETTCLNSFTYYSKLVKFVAPKNLTSTDEFNVFEGSTLLKEIILPNSFIELGNRSFLFCESLEEIMLPKYLKRIGEVAFGGCSSLKNVIIPAHVSQIECAAFCGCFALDKFEVNEYNTYFFVLDGVLFNYDKSKLIAFPCGKKINHYIVPNGVKIIGAGSFNDSKIESISFPSSLQTIEEEAFSFCDNLKSIEIPDSVIEIGEYAFQYCLRLETVKLSKNLTHLKRQTFCGTEKLTEIDIPSSIKEIEPTAIGWSKSIETIYLHDGLEILDDLTCCKTLKNIIIPKTVKKIASGIFRESIHISEILIDKDNPYFSTYEGSLYNYDKTKLIAVPNNQRKKFIIPNGVVEIEDFVFEGFYEIEQIIFPETVQIIGHRAFDECRKIKIMRLPKSLKFLDFRSFDNCDHLEILEIQANIPPIITNPLTNGNKFCRNGKEITLFVPNESLELYKKAFGWSDIKKIEILKSN